MYQASLVFLTAYLLRFHYSSCFRKINNPITVDKAIIIKAFITIPKVRSGEKSTEDTTVTIPYIECLIPQSTNRLAVAERLARLLTANKNVSINNT